MTSVPFSGTTTADEPVVHEEGSSLAHKAMWVVLAVLLVGTVVFMVGVPMVKERALFEGTKTVGQNAAAVVELLPSADTFTVGALNGAGTFEAFEDGVVPAGVSSFMLRASVSDGEGVAVMKLLEKPDGVTLRVDAVEGSPGEFTVSAFDKDAAIHRGPGLGESVVYSSTGGKVKG